MQEGIFSNDKLADNEVEFCVFSDVHIANDDGDVSRSLTNQGRNDYIFANNKTWTPISGEAYTLKRFCEKVNWSGRCGHFDDGKHVAVFLGDIINGECGYFASYNSIAYKMLSSAFMPWFDTGNIVYVPGNHDREARFYSVMTNFPRKCIVEEQYERCGIIFKHGHQFDFLCNGKSLLGMSGEIASNVVVKLFSPKTEDLLRNRGVYHDKDSSNHIRDLHSLPQYATLQTMSNENKRVAENAMKELVRRSAGDSKNPPMHTIVCGHTHQAPVMIQMRNSRLLTYFNTGKFAKDGYINIRVRCKYPDLNVWELV